MNRAGNHDCNNQYHLSSKIKILEDIIDYGECIIDKCLSQGIDLENKVIVGHFFKQIVSIADSVHVLITNGCVPTTYILLRSFIETYIYLNWILYEHTNCRAKCFHVAFLRKTRREADRLMSGTDANKRFDKLRKTAGISSASEADNAVTNEKICAMISDTDNILSMQKYRNINAQFDKLRNKKSYDPEWYKVGGAKSIKYMAKKMNMVLEYEWYYEQHTQTTHSRNIRSNIILNEKYISLPIRTFNDSDTVIQEVAAVLFESYDTIIKKRAPSMLQDFKAKLKEWMSVCFL